jgi:hypothetical protein
MCLVSLAVLNSAPPVFASVGFDPIDTPLEQVQDKLKIIMAMLVLLPTFVWAFCSMSNSAFCAKKTATETGNLEKEQQNELIDREENGAGDNNEAGWPV